MEYLHKTDLQDRYNGLVKFSMTRLTVDEIDYKNPLRTFDTWMVSYVDELDDDDHPSDVGQKFVWLADDAVSENHWLHCGRVVRLGRLCEVCGRLATE